VESGLARSDTDGVRLEAREQLRAGEKLVQPMTVDELEQRVRSAR
jgi:hypothetical protein